MKQEAPFTIQLELTEGCNLMCKFCGIKGIRSKAGNYKFLSIENAEVIAKRIKESKWNCKLEFAMHGEPTTNPNCAEIIHIFRKQLPELQMMMTTNGFKITKKENIEKLFDSGINIIALDDYGHNPFSKKISKITRELNCQVTAYPLNKKQSPHNRYSADIKILIFVEDISISTKGTHSNLNNHCGCAFPPLINPLNKRCAKPFRELSIRWDGSIAICCNDWVGYYKCGNVIEKSIEDIWNGKEFNAARKILYSAKRNFIPCRWCNAISYRVGFLPDKMGKKTLPQPSKVTYNIAKRSAGGKPLALPQKLIWKGSISSIIK